MAIVSHGLIGTHPHCTTFSGKDDVKFSFTLTDVVKALNQTQTYTNPLPGMWDITMIYNGAPVDWAYKKVTLAAAITTASGVPNVGTVGATDFAALEAGSYYQNLTTGEILFINNKEGTDTIFMTRGLFGTSVGAISLGDVLVCMNTVEYTPSADGFGMLFYIPMPQPGFGQKYFSV